MLAVYRRVRVCAEVASISREVRNSSGTLLDQNDDGKSDTQQARIQATGVAPTNDLESALIATLPAGADTAILRGLNNTTGIGLVEVYNLQ